MVSQVNEGVMEQKGSANTRTQPPGPAAQSCVRIMEHLESRLCSSA